MSLRNLRAGPGDTLRLSLLFFAVLAGYFVLNLPDSYSLRWIGFSDSGANFAIQSLLGRGWLPRVDFAYSYGLLPLVLLKAWFAAFGAVPLSYLATGLVLHVFQAWNLARFAVALRARAELLALLVVALPFGFMPLYSTLAHGLEAVLITAALAEQARGRKPAALALVTACLFVKPSLAYFYGLLLLVLILFEDRPRSARELARALGPATACFVGLAVFLAAWFSPLSLVRTLLPLSGLASYAVHDLGFFTGHGRNFWRPDGVNWHYYVGTLAGFWLVGSVALFVAGLQGVWKAARARPPGSPRPRGPLPLAVSLAFLHGAFVCVLFSNAWGWMKYSYLLLFALPTIGFLEGMPALTGVLILLALTGQKSRLTALHEAWTTAERTPYSAGLWSSREETAEWSFVRELLRGHPGVLLVSAGAADLLFPEFVAPETGFFYQGSAMPADIERKRKQLREASRLVIPKLGDFTFFGEWPELRPEVADMSVLYDGRFFQILGRR